MSGEPDRVAVNTYVPTTQRDRWRADAEALGMSQSEFVRSMVQAGRRGFSLGGSTPNPAEPDLPGSSPRSDGLKTAVLDLLRNEGRLGWPELVDELTGDLEEELEAALTELQAESSTALGGETTVSRRRRMASEAAASDVDDPVGYFVEEMTYHGRTERTRHAYDRVLREFEAFLQDRGATIESAGRRDCMAWLHEIRGTAAESTIATYASYVNRFYSYMTRVGALERNPMALVVEEMDETIDANPDRREISVRRMREFVSDVRHPLDRALIVTLLKTGIRVGELSNLDLRDLYLNDEEVASAYAVSPRPTIEERPDSLYVPSEPSRGHEYNGEVRSASNKRKRSTVVPVDGELKRVLKAWLAVRPDGDSPAEPLFLSTSEWGRRVTPSMVRAIVTDHARAVGWHRPGGGAEENVTPHYFRHFFTTHLRDRTGDRGVVKYLRGDVADDVIDTYTHNWGDRVREVYEQHVYSLL